MAVTISSKLLQSMGQFNSNNLKIYLKLFFKSDFGIFLCIALGWQIFMTFWGLLIDRGLASLVNPASPSYAHPIGHTLLSPTLRWDGLWFLGIIHGSYKTSSYSPAFYPMFPSLVYILRLATFNILGFLVSGLIINTLALWMSLVALFKICKLLLGKRIYGWMAVVFFLTFPAAFFLHAFYSEGVFCAFAFWSYYLALKRRWGWMALSLACLTATRVTAILVVILCLLEFFRANKWKIKKTLNKSILWFLITPLGFVAYGLYLVKHGHKFLAMIHAEHLWTYQVFNLDFILTYLRQIRVAFNGIFGVTPYRPEAILVNFALPVVVLFVLLITSLIAIFYIRDWGIPLGVSGILSFIMFTLNNNVISSHRFVLTCIVLYISTAFLVKKHRGMIFPVGFAVAAGLMMQTVLYILFISNYFAG
jgi:hypothetical protein